MIGAVKGETRMWSILIVLGVGGGCDETDRSLCYRKCYFFSMAEFINVIYRNMTENIEGKI